MLIRFSVENFRSYKEKQIFSMIAGKHTKHKDHLVEIKGKRILKGSFLFGANAAGKSNLFESIRFARNIIMKGIRKNSLINKHFRIDDTCVNRPGVFQFDIFSNGHFYSYGFAISYTDAAIIEEWLYLCDGTETAVFERSMENGNTIVNSSYRFSSDNHKQTFTIFADNVPDNKTLLLEISERKLIEHEDFYPFRDVMQWIKDLIIILPDSTYRDKTNLFVDDESDFDLAKLLYEFDTGIDGITLGKESAEEVLSFLPDKLKAEIIQDIEIAFNEKNADGQMPQEIECEVGGRFIRFTKYNNQIVAAQLMMNHGNENDPFDLYDESDGTQRLFDLLPVYRAGRTEHVILVDELDRSFHTVLVQKFIQGFYQTSAYVNSQLIASVHDSNIMNLDLLRQDEIWFVERSNDHSSRIYSLNRFQERFDKKVAKDYLLGRYGAIPCFTQIVNDDAED